MPAILSLKASGFYNTILKALIIALAWATFILFFISFTGEKAVCKTTFLPYYILEAYSSGSVSSISLKIYLGNYDSSAISLSLSQEVSKCSKILS